MKKINILGVAVFIANGFISAQTPATAPAAPKPGETPVKTTETKPPATTQPSDAAKPESAKPVTPAQPTPPAVVPVPVTDKDKLPVISPAKPPEPELNEETKRQIEAAKQKILKEKAEREEAERKTREEASKKLEREKTFLGGLAANSKLYAGMNGGLALSMNNIHATGFGLGGFIQYQAHEHYGFRVGVETGQYSAKNYKLKSGDYTLTLAETGSLGYLAINPALQYTLPAWLPVEFSIALGVSIYSLKGGTYAFKSTVAPYALLTALYPVFTRLHVGLAVDATILSASQIESDGVAYKLDSSESLMRLGGQVLVRYQIF